MESVRELLKKAEEGFGTIDIAPKYVKSALGWLENWLTDEAFAAYGPQIAFLIESCQWNLLLDAFYQIIPFGTGGRRGLVGIGPNRINPWTIQSSAQGHAQYLLAQYGEDAAKRGVVLAYDVRKYTEKGVYDDSLANPVMDLDCRELALAAARVYAANGLTVLIFDGARCTPQLSFTIRHLNAVAGAMFSASHNLPTDNGKKVYDEFGGQLIPPYDQNLVDEVTENVARIRQTSISQAEADGLVRYLGEEVDQAYYDAVSAVSLSKVRDLSILYSPLHGTGLSSVYPVLTNLGFDVKLDPATSNMSGAFENVTFNIPNPEVLQSFDTCLASPEAASADIILNSDPDADRIGVMAKHEGKWEFLNGNEIGALLTDYGIEKGRGKGDNPGGAVVIKTDVTSSLIGNIAAKNGVRCIGDLLVGFKYIGCQMNALEERGEMGGFILGTEESHGYIMGNYCRDKDAAAAAVWLAEIAAELKGENRTLVDRLNEIYGTYGYCHNHLTEIRLLGAKGNEQIRGMMKHLRETEVSGFGDFAVVEKRDRWDGEPNPHLSVTDTWSRDVLTYRMENSEGTQSIRIVVRPSGTEPKIKMYFEVLGNPFDVSLMAEEREALSQLRQSLEKAFMTYCYGIIGVAFPDRGFLLFWQLPLDLKLRYFTLEGEIEGLSAVADAGQRRAALEKTLLPFGANPVMKVDGAFKEKHGMGILTYLNLA